MAMFPLRSSCFVDAAVAAHNALELAIDDATSQVGNPTSVLGGWGTGSEPQLLRNSRRGCGSLTAVLESAVSPRHACVQRGTSKQGL